MDSTSSWLPEALLFCPPGPAGIDCQPALRSLLRFLHTLPVILYLFRGPVFIRVNPKCTLSRLSVALHSRQPTHSHYTFTLPAIPPFSNFLIDTLVMFYFLTYLHLTTVSGIHANTFSSGPAADFRAGPRHT
jgi:hypothetical protein